MRKPKFDIGDKVYHITPDSDLGIVLDCKYSMRFDIWTYTVTFSIDKDDMEFYEDELSITKTF